MKNKSLTMFVAAILIAVFHLWINVTSMGSVASDIEDFVQFICFIGVDMFFAISAFSIAQSNTENYKEFIKKRFSKIYNKFLLFAIIAFILESWTISRLLKVASGIELFARGGGSFLWFAPVILIVYLLLPLYKKVDEHYPKASPVFAILLWLAIGLLLTKLNIARQIFIFYNRIPIVLLGFYMGKYDVLNCIRQSRFRYIVLALSLMCIGVAFVYFGSYQSSANRFLYDFFYISGIPLSIGLVMILDILPKVKIIDSLSRCTFEMYGIQMIFGFKAADMIYKNFGSAVFSNIVTIVLLILVAFILEKIFANLQRL